MNHSFSLTTLRRSIKHVTERVLGVTVSRPQHGVRDCDDIAACGSLIECIFDVGANTGQSAARFREFFPHATIHCFEPVRKTYATLVEHMHSDPLTHCHRLALSDTVGESRIFLTENSSTCSLSRPAAYIGEETVVVSTVDAFATAQGVDHIDLLKIDAEGNDLKVLEGSDDLLVAGSISLILVEVGFNPGDDRHVLFDSVRDLLATRGFRLFGIYGQQPEWSGEKRLRFANALFCNEVNLRHSRSPLSK
jgi:FkbM family methyltransferase